MSKLRDLGGQTYRQKDRNNLCNGMHDSDYDITCATLIPSISSTLKKLLLEYNFYSSYNQTKYIGEEEIIHNIFSAYVKPYCF